MEVDLSKVSVTIGMPAGSNVPPQTVISIASTVSQCAAMGIRCEFVLDGSGGLNISRDCIIDHFLRDDTQKLFWIDSDMTWEPEDFLRLLALSTQRDVVCATYPAKFEGAARYQIDMDLGAVELDPLGLLEIRGAGLGFTVMGRSVCQQVSDSKPVVVDSMSGREMREVFRLDTVNGRRRTEDMAFFADIRELGHKVWLDPSINLGHVGQRQWTGVVMDAFQRN